MKTHRLVLAPLLVFFSVTAARGQVLEPVPNLETTSIAELTAQFIREVGSPPARRSNAEPAMFAMLLQRNRSYHPARVDSLVTALETIGRSAEYDSYTRAAAASLLIAGSGTHSRRPLPNGLARVRRVYEASVNDAMVRGTILTMLYRVQERQGALDWLSDLVGRAPSDQGYPQESEDAVRGMLGFGRDGNDRLRVISAQGRVRNPNVAAFVQDRLERESRPRSE